MKDGKISWPHFCSSCNKDVHENEAIDKGPDKNNMPVYWYDCPTCENTFVQYNEDELDEKTR